MPDDPEIHELLTEGPGGQLQIIVDDPGDTPGDVVAPSPHSTATPPRLHRVWMKHFKGFKSFEVELGNFNVIAGANNAGKSTLLQGVDLLYSLLKLHAEGNHLAPKGRLVPAVILPVATIRDLFYRQAWREGNAYVNVEVGADFLDGSSVGFGLRHMFGNVNSQVLSNTGVEDARLTALLGHPAVWVPSAVGIVREEEYRPPARQRGLISVGRHNEVLRNLLVELKTSAPDRLTQIQTILNARFGAGIGDVAFDSDLDQFVTGTYKGSDGTEHDLYSAGSGFVQVLQMLVFVFARSPSVVLLDEPDAHLHSSLQRIVVEILDDLSKSENFQVLLATHSKEIINFVDPSRLILVEQGADAAALVTAEVAPITVLKTLGAVDNVDAYALVRNKRCLFLEGTTDATILGRFAATLGIHAFTGEDRVVTVPVGGADKFEHVQQLNVFEALLGDGPLRTLELRDRDGRIEEFRDAVMAQAERPLHVLELDCIESYLVNTAVLARVIADIMEERGKDDARPSVEEIVHLVDEAIESLRQETEDRLADRYNQDVWTHRKERPSVKEANQAARQLVEQYWGSIDERLHVVSGKRLLASVRGTIQERYGVNFGNERLAEAFQSDEIPRELVTQLEAVSNLMTA